MSSRLMQRKFSEPNTYIDGLPSRDCQEELYDDVEMSELMAAVSTWMGHQLTSPSPAKPLSQRFRLSPRQAVPSHLQDRLLCEGSCVTWLSALIFGAGHGE